MKFGQYESRDDVSVEHGDEEKSVAIVEAKVNYPDYYHDWQVECLEAIKDKKHVVLMSPTGSGKTTVFLDWGKSKQQEAMEAGEEKHTIYITAPIKALSNQRFYELWKDGYNVGLETGDIKIVPKNAEYICCTQEIYNAKYVEDGNATLIVDEFGYLFENPDRARAYIDGLRQAKAENSLICSATFGDMTKATSYLEMVTGQEQYGYENHERLTEIGAQGKITPDKIRDALVVSFSAQNCKRVADALYEVRKDGVVRRYRYEKDDWSGEWEEKEYEEPVEAEYVRDDERAEAVAKLAEAMNIHNPELIRWAEYGIATYYGDMLPKEKLFVERAFEERLIDTVAGTDALALGVNFPVEKVVFGQMAKYKDGPISKNMYSQLSGRAGRLGYFDRGEVYYCEDFYWTDRKGRHHSIEARGYSTEMLFKEMQDQPNENFSIELAPNYKAVLNGESSPEDEIAYMKQYSTVEIDEEKLMDYFERMQDYGYIFFHEVVERTMDIYAEEEPRRWDGFYEDGLRDFAEHYRWDEYEVEYDDKSETIHYGEKSPSGTFYRGSFYLGEDVAYKEAEASVMKKYGVTSKSDFKKKLGKVFAKCYDLQLDPGTNMIYALDVLAGDRNSFDQRVKDFTSIRDLMALRGYLMGLPTQYRKIFAGSVVNIEQRINSIDETILNKNAGLIQMIELDKLLQERNV